MGRGTRTVELTEVTAARGLRLAVLAAAALLLLPAAGDTPNPASVTIAGSLQSEAGCAGDWDPACATTHLTYDASDDVWQGTFTLPAGSYEYKAALNDAWDENYGLHAAVRRREHPARPRSGGPRQVLLRPQEPLGHRQQELGDRGRGRRASSPSSAARATGTPTACARGSRTRTATAPTPSRRPRCRPGSYETKVAINEGWDENYGAGGVPGGATSRSPFRSTTRRSPSLRRRDARAHGRRSRRRRARRAARARCRTSTSRARTASAPRATRPRRSGTRSRAAFSATSTTRRSTTPMSRRCSTSSPTARPSPTSRRAT